ncbi:hypothetical protein [Aureimonas sp. ME7]|uniref:hypothetical protein n=1 Tax=Aureimonas sp. ME7 TaxID=2744252 RepID=UPI0015F76620|nr:hypothetical protein [Aureimonas sp. ME7]
MMFLSVVAFATGYLAPGAMPAHAHSGAPAIAGDCAGMQRMGAQSPKVPVSQHAAISCCVAHCLPAVPIAWPVLPDAPAEAVRILTIWEARSDGTTLSVPLPPPRSLVQR